MSVNVKVEKPINYFNRLEHYKGGVGPTTEFGNKAECEPTPKNIGWTLGNDCPYRCTHCYSMNAREKGQNMTKPMIDRVVEQLVSVGVETVNLGGNEPLFTNGINPKDTLLPYIIERLHEAGIITGLTTSGITLLRLYRDYRSAFDMLNDVDVSFDSPFKDEHNANRGANIFHQAVESLDICKAEGIPHSVIMAAMRWNFTEVHIRELVILAKKHAANVRINPLKPVEPQHMDVALTPKMYYTGFSLLMNLCSPLDLGEPPLAAKTTFPFAKRCPCGRTSFRIHSITPTGEIYISPCVYLHDFKSEIDLLKHDLADIIVSPPFRAFRQRNANPDMIEGCNGCDMLSQCGGGCVARSYLNHFHTSGGKRSLLARDPYCPKEFATEYEFPHVPEIHSEHRLVHMDYLCTWIGQPR